MFIEESLLIRDLLERLPLGKGSEVLDAGSSTAYFRNVTQPHIAANVFAPLERRGCRVTCMDSKEGEGVDIVCGVDDPGRFPLAHIARYDLVLCTNLLEHVARRDEAARMLLQCARPGGFVLVTVPGRYREDADPVDTLYRPTAGELEGLFRGLDTRLVTVYSETVVIHDPAYYGLRPRRNPFFRYADRVRYVFPSLRWNVRCLLLRTPGL